MAMLKRDGGFLRLTICKVVGLPCVTQLLFTNLVPIEVKEVTGWKSFNDSTTAY
jgi:hypothetical protein